ncbi:MAG TPA: hypothetical protein DCP28_10405 [Cytophagales bacterium]|nr:hypothetical protein [Cytophagales bacterium]
MLEGGQTKEEAFAEATRELGTALELGEEEHKARLTTRGQWLYGLIPALSRHSLRVALRQFRRDRLYVWINLGGLALGLTACILLTYFVAHETSYDKRYEGEPLYRVAHQERKSSGEIEKNAGGPVPLGLVLREDFSQVAEATRFWRAFRPSLKAGEAVHMEEAFLWADPNSISMMGFEVVQGSAESALRHPNTLAISESAALRYFGHTQVIGQEMHYVGFPASEWDFTITAVLADPPQNTHFRYDFIGSLQGMNDFSESWGSLKPLWTYVRLYDKSQAGSFAEALKIIPQKYFHPNDQRGEEFAFFPEHISDAHLRSGAGNTMKNIGDPSLLRLLSMLGVLILVMVCVNFINISIARSVTRQKEIGVRKVLGARRVQVMGQVLAEVVVSVALATALAFLLAYLLKRPFKEVTGLQFELDFLLEPRFGFTLLAVLAILVLGAGLYPALRLAGFKTLPSLAGKVFVGRKNSVSLRQGLIFFQCAISSILVVAVLVIQDQLAYIQNKELGVEIDQMIAIPYSDTPELFAAELDKLPGVEGYIHSQRLPVNTMNRDGRVLRKVGDEDYLEVQSAFLEPGFLDIYEIELAAGRSFNPLTQSDTAAFVINEKLAAEMGWSPQEALGQRLVWSEYQEGEVVGVVKDFHILGVRYAIPPLVMLPTYEQRNWQRLFLSIKLVPGMEAATQLAIQRAWQRHNPDREFSLIEMPLSYAQLHQNDQTFARLILFFTVLAIAISSLGLFALSAYSAERKRREIGIRKVLGSNAWQIIQSIGRPFILLSLSSLLIALPAAWWWMEGWLSEFAYRTQLQPMTLVLGGMLMVAISLVSVLRESLRAGWVNPVKFLREE